jgi:RNA polymerase sigma-70 factor (ECF subfamily)
LHRAVLIDVAYRIVEQVVDAKDVVQDAWLRWSRVDADEIRVPRAFLVRVTTRLALDRLRLRKAQRETYVGESGRGQCACRGGLNRCRRNNLKA